MTSLEQIADRVTKQIANKYQYFTTGARDDIRSLIIREFSPIVVQQQELPLTSSDEKVNGEQSEKILQLLKQRRSQGATNWELAEIALKYTSRVSNLREQGYRVECRREAGRIWRYRLSATDW